MQRKKPRELVKLAGRIGGVEWRKTKNSNWYIVFHNPLLNCMVSVRYRHCTDNPERRGFLVYWPFPTPGMYVASQERRTFPTVDAVRDFLGLRPESERRWERKTLLVAIDTETGEFDIHCNGPVRVVSLDVDALEAGIVNSVEEATSDFIVSGPTEAFDEQMRRIRSRAEKLVSADDGGYKAFENEEDGLLAEISTDVNAQGAAECGGVLVIRDTDAGCVQVASDEDIDLVVADIDFLEWRSDESQPVTKSDIDAMLTPRFIKGTPGSVAATLAAKIDGLRHTSGYD